jgi:Tfp pilus assembly protein PilE
MNDEQWTMNYEPMNFRFRNADCGIKTLNSELPACPLPVRQAGAGRRTLNFKGFTLIELILIMIIIGILAATVMTRIDFTISTTASLDGAAYIVASDVRYAQEYAMANRVEKDINFTQNSSTYTFTPASNLDPSGQLPSGVTISSPTYTLRFNSLGEPISIPLANQYVDLTVSGGGSSKTIRIWNFTGKAQIQP